MTHLHNFSVIRDFGEWALVTCALAEKTYLNKGTGQMCVDPPKEVLEILSLENAKRRLPVYEPTKNHFTTLPAVESLPPTRKEELLDVFGESAMVLHDLFTPSECVAIITQAENFGFEGCGYSKTMRITDRVPVMGEELAGMLFERVKSLLPPILVHRTMDGLKPFGVRPDMAEGTWVATGLNPCFRACRYVPGGFFQPHYDGGFDYSSKHRSIKTYMLYLNDGFEGGSTTFYEEDQRHYSEPDRSKAVYDFQPELGACLVFNHFICHDGGVLKTGKKYILRSEVMYEWVSKNLAAG